MTTARGENWAGSTRAAVLRPFFITMVLLAIVVFGLVSYTRLGVNLLPTVNIPAVTVVTAYPGASRDSVESLVAVPLEVTNRAVLSVEERLGKMPEVGRVFRGVPQLDTVPPTDRNPLP
jgi:hypothetical protein